MKKLKFERNEFGPKLTETPYGEQVEVRKNKVGKRSHYSYKIGNRGWGRFYTKDGLNKMLKPYKIKVL